MAAMATGNWAYAVPLDETNGFVQPQRNDTIKPQDPPRAPTHTPRSTSAQPRADAWDVRSDSGATDSRRTSIKQSNMATATRKRSRNALRDKVNQQAQQAQPAGPNEDSAWIHRDKLAQIEIQEMADAGFHVRPSRRSESAGPGVRDNRSQSRNETRRPRSRERDTPAAVELPADPPLDEETGRQYASFDDYAKKKRTSTIPAADEEEHEYDTEAGTQIRTPEEVAADHSHRQHTLRPSTSRIPISKAGAVPVPQQVVDRDSPLPRSRSGSGAWGGTWDETQYERKARSNSIGSQNLLDDAEGKTTPPPGSRASAMKDKHSPPKSRLPNKSLPAPGASKVSALGSTSGTGRPPSSHLKKKNLASSQRPGSRNGAGSSASQNAPEGDPPWLVNTYKPDPRLPPDQQMLPTHAKRMMQEQWEKDGKTGTAYDRELRLLNDEEIVRKSPSPQMLHSPGALSQEESKPSPLIATHSPNGEPTSPAWPLTPRSDTSLRPSTSGGYKITPTIGSPPSIHRRSKSPVKMDATSIPPVNNATPRLPELDEKHDIKPKKFCCCVMM